MGKGILLDIFYDTELSAEEGHESGFTDWRAWTPEMINDVFETNFQNGEYLLDTTLNTLDLSDYILPSSNPHEAFSNNIGPVEIQLTNLDNETYIVSAYPILNEQGELTHLIQYDPNNQTNPSRINQFELTTAYGEILDMRSLYQGSQQFLMNGEAILQQLHNTQTPTINQAQEAFVSSYAWGVSGYQPDDNPLDVQQMQLFEQVLPGVMTQSNMVTYTLDNSEAFLTPAVQSMLAEASNPDQAYWDFIRMSGQTLSHFQLTGATYFDENNLIQARTTESHPITPEIEVWLSNAGGENGARQRLMAIFERNGAQCQVCAEGDLFEIALEATTLLQAESILAWQEQQSENPDINSDTALAMYFVSQMGSAIWDWLDGDPQFAKDMQWIQELQDGMIDRPRPYNDMGALLATLGIPDEPTAREYLEQGFIELGYSDPTWWSDELTIEEFANAYVNENNYPRFVDDDRHWIDDVDAFLATLQPQDEIRARQTLEIRLAEFTGISENLEWDAMSTLGLAELYYNLISDELDNPDSDLIHEDLLLNWNQMAGIEMESADLGWVGMALEITGSILFEPVDYVLTTRDIISDITNNEVSALTFVAGLGYLPLIPSSFGRALRWSDDLSDLIRLGIDDDVARSIVRVADDMGIAVPNSVNRLAGRRGNDTALVFLNNIDASDPDVIRRLLSDDNGLVDDVWEQTGEATVQRISDIPVTGLQESDINATFGRSWNRSSDGSIIAYEFSATGKPDPNIAIYLSNSNAEFGYTEFDWYRITAEGNTILLDAKFIGNPDQSWYNSDTLDTFIAQIADNKTLGEARSQIIAAQENGIDAIEWIVSDQAAADALTALFANQLDEMVDGILVDFDIITIVGPNSLP